MNKGKWIFENYTNTQEFFLRNTADDILYPFDWDTVFNFLASGGQIEGLHMDGGGIYYIVTETVQQRVTRGGQVTPAQMARGINAKLRCKCYCR